MSALLLLPVTLLACNAKGPTVENARNRTSNQPTGVYYSLPRSVVMVQFSVTKTKTTPTSLGRVLAAAYESDTGKSETVDDGGGRTRPKRPKRPTGEPPTPPGDGVIAQAGEVSLEDRAQIVLDGAKNDVHRLKELLGFKDLGALEHGSTRYTIDVEDVGTRAEPDPEEVYFVHITGQPGEKRHLSLQMTALGLLSGASAKSEDMAGVAALELIRAGGTVLSAAVPGGGIAAHAGATGKKRPEGEAGLLYDARWELEALHDRRTRLLTDIAGVDVETLKYALNEIQRDINKVKGRFRKAESTMWRFPLEYVPTRADFRSGEARDRIAIELFRFGARSGVEVGSGPAFPLDVPETFQEGDPESAAPQPVTLVIETLPGSARFTDVVAAARARTPESGAQSFRYRIPAQVRVRVHVPGAGHGRGGGRAHGGDHAAGAAGDPGDDGSDGGDDHSEHGDQGAGAAKGGGRQAKGRAPTGTVSGDVVDCGDRASCVAARILNVPQLGVVASLPINVGGQVSNYDLKFFSDLGALMEVTLSGEPGSTGGMVVASGDAIAAALGGGKAGKGGGGGAGGGKGGGKGGGGAGGGGGGMAGHDAHDEMEHMKAQRDLANQRADAMEDDR